MVTPYTLFPNNMTAAVNIARVLQSVNTGLTTGIIELNSTMIANMQADSDFTSTTFATNMEHDLGITLLSASQATRVMNASIIENGGSFISLSGVVVDGSIYGAKVCLDININGKCDSVEPTTTTNWNGSFTLNILPINDIHLKPIISIGGFDTRANVFYKGELKTIVSSSTSSVVLSPITDLIATSYLELNTTGISVLEDVENTIANTLNIDRSSLYTDPMDDKTIFQKSLQLRNAKELLEMGVFSQLPAWNSPSIDFGKRQGLRKTIKLELANTSNFVQNDFSSVLDVITSQNDINVSHYEKEFIAKQLEKFNTRLSELSSSQIDKSKFLFLQLGIELLIDNIYDNFEANSSNITVISMPSLESLIVNTEQNNTACMDAVTYAINPDTKMSERFSTPCEVPTNWVISSMDGFYYATDGYTYQDTVNYLDLHRLNIGDIQGSFCRSEISGSRVISTTCVDSTINGQANKYISPEYILPVEMLGDIDRITNKKLPYERAFIDSNESFGMILSDMYWGDVDGNRISLETFDYNGMNYIVDPIINNTPTTYLFSIYEYVKRTIN